MKKTYIIFIILIVSAVMPFQLLAQNAGSTDVFRQDGIASWYGREFEGRPTASGEIFDSSQLTAAHPTLPFGTRLIVTNQHNNKSVTVRVNDRGPFVPARIIDVSRAAAERLDMIVTGTAPVSVVSIDRIVISSPAVGAQMAPAQMAPAQMAPAQIVPVQAPQHIAAAAPSATFPVTTATTAPAAAPVTAPTVMAPANTAFLPQAENISAFQGQSAPIAAAQPAFVYVSQPPVIEGVSSQLRVTPELQIVPNKNYRFQVGSFRNARNAVDVFDRLKNSGLNPAYERFTSADNVEFYRVVVAGVSGSNVRFTSDRISAAGFKEAIIREEN